MNILDVAIKEIGVKERPAGSNKVKYNTWYYGHEVSGSSFPWCMTFVQWCANEAKVKLPLKTASCTTFMEQAKGRKMWYTKGFRAGDIVLFNFSKGKNASTAEHVGIIKAVHKDAVETIEGNTSLTSNDNGGSVMVRMRNPSVILGVCRLEDKMTGEEIYKALNEYLKTLPAPEWAKEELDEAVRMGITDGTRPCELIPRYQAAIMAKRAHEKN